MPDPVAEAQELLVDTVETFEKLEVVRLLARGTPRPLDVLMAELAIPLEIARETLRELAAKQIVREGPAGWMIDASGPRHEAILALVKLYDQDRIGIVNRMTKIALERIRVNAARTFADAFVLRPRTKKDDDK